MSYNITFEKMIKIMKREYPDDFNRLDWKSISNFNSLSEDFIEEFSDNVVWSIICTFQKLSEDFINKYIDKVNFKVISNLQISHLSIDFIFENKDKLDIKIIKQNKKFYSKKNIISYTYKKNKNEVSFLYSKYSFYDDYNILLLNKFINKSSNRITSTQTQDNEFYDYNYHDNEYFMNKVLKNKIQK